MTDRTLAGRPHRLTGALTLLVGLLALHGHTWAGPQSGYIDMSPEQLAEHLIFEQGGFDLDQDTQEGGTVRDRLRQDEIQTLCSALRGEPVDDATADKVVQLALDSIEYPDGGVDMGDWKKGEKIALNAFGYRVGHKVDDHSKQATGGLCINCHVMDPQADVPGGSVGPELEMYGDELGRSAPVIEATYEMIYNPHAKFPCTKMPRIGANGILSPEQILDVIAYLHDPESPVNN